MPVIVDGACENICRLQISNMLLFAVLLLGSSYATPQSQPDPMHVTVATLSLSQRSAPLPTSSHQSPPIGKAGQLTNPLTKLVEDFSEEFSNTILELSETATVRSSIRDEVNPLFSCEPCSCDNETMYCSDRKLRSFLVPKPHLDVKYLDISNNDFEELPESVFAMLPNLRDISLSNNHINKINTAAFHGLDNIKQIDLSSNIINKISSEMLAKLSTLERFYLLRNRLKDIGFIAQIRNCSLQVLQVSANAITSIPKHAFGRCTHLKEIWIDGNKISEVNEDAFEGLINLLTLDLSENQILDIPRATFRSLNALRSLDLSRNWLTTVDEQLFKPLTSLDSLYLSFNWLSSIPPKVFSPCASLRRLDLSENLISDVDSTAFVSPDKANLSLFANKSIHPKCANLTSRSSNIPIEYLDLSHNHLRSVPAQAFLALPKIEQLNLEDNLITSFGPDFVCLASKLHDGLRFTGNHLVCTCESLNTAFRFAERIAPDFQPECLHTEESWVILRGRQCEIPKITSQARSAFKELPPPQSTPEDYTLDASDEPQQSSMRATVLGSILAVAFIAAMAAFTAEVVKCYRRGKYEFPAGDEIQMTQFARTTSIRVNEDSPKSAEEVTAIIVKETENEVSGHKEAEKCDRSQIQLQESDDIDEISKL